MSRQGEASGKHRRVGQNVAKVLRRDKMVPRTSLLTHSPVILPGMLSCKKFQEGVWSGANPEKEGW